MKGYEAKKKIRIETCLCKNSTDKLLIDENRLSQVIINLLSNAVKFTSIGTVIKLNARVEPQQNDVSYIVLEVVDKGLGISPVERT